MFNVREYALNGSNGEVIKHPPVNDSAAEIETMAQQQYEHIRFIRAGHSAPAMPALELPPPHDGGDMKEVNGWTVPCPVIGGKRECRVDFSAMCWFYGRDIYTVLAVAGKARPIGLIESCWSGSPDEDWMSGTALDKCIDPKSKPRSNGGMFNGMIRYD